MNLITIVALFFSLSSNAEDRVLLSVHKATKEVAVTYFPWIQWRKESPGLTDAQIWASKWQAEVPPQFKSSKYKNFGSTISAFKKLTPRDRKNRARWRWGDAAKKVYEAP